MQRSGKQKGKQAQHKTNIPPVATTAPALPPFELPPLLELPLF
jgi:hypothetical protein